MRDYLIILVVMIIIDIIYVIPTSSWVKNILLNVQGQPADYKIIPLLLVYPIMALPVRILVLPLLDKENLIIKSIQYGGVLGLGIYGTYELLNLGTFVNWDPWFSVCDCIWGFVQMSITSGLSFFIIDKLNNRGPGNEVIKYLI